MMESNGSFRDYAWKGMDALLRVTARAGEALRNASNRSIDRLDLWQLEKKRDKCYLQLGKKVSQCMDAGTLKDSADPEIESLRVQIATVTAEITRRKEIQVSGKKE